jgi:transposase InsO family protein
MEQRAQFVLDALSGRFSMSELCYRYGVSRKTGYKWIARYHQQGLPGVEDRPRVPFAHPNATPPKIVARVVKARKRNPGWGPVTLRARLCQDFPEVQWPCPSTIGEILKRHELIRKYRRRPPRATWRSSRTKADQPNRVWTADFKGQFRLGNGVLCYPLTVADLYSRYLLVCRGLRDTGVRAARRAFEAAFREFGLPDVIRTDNGVPFAAPGSPLGLSALSVWFLKLGIILERSRPGKPQDNGAHERMHRTLKEEAARPPRRNEAAQQRALDRFRRVYNEERPHHALQLKTPASRYTKSERPYPEDLPDPEYPPHFEARRVTKIGVFTFRCRPIFISASLRHELLGLEHVADGIYSVFFGDVLLGRLNEEDSQFIAGATR